MAMARVDFCENSIRGECPDPRKCRYKHIVPRQGEAIISRLCGVCNAHGAHEPGVRIGPNVHGIDSTQSTQSTHSTYSTQSTYSAHSTHSASYVHTLWFLDGDNMVNTGKVVVDFLRQLREGNHCMVFAHAGVVSFYHDIHNSNVTVMPATMTQTKDAADIYLAGYAMRLDALIDKSTQFMIVTRDHFAKELVLQLRSFGRKALWYKPDGVATGASNVDMDCVERVRQVLRIYGGKVLLSKLSTLVRLPQQADKFLTPAVLSELNAYIHSKGKIGTEELCLNETEDEINARCITRLFAQHDTDTLPLRIVEAHGVNIGRLVVNDTLLDSIGCELRTEECLVAKESTRTIFSQAREWIETHNSNHINLKELGAHAGKGIGWKKILSDTTNILRIAPGYELCQVGEEWILRRIGI